MIQLRNSFRQILKYPSAILGGVIILALIGIALYTVIAIPYNEATHLWRSGESVWQDYPRNARPAWTNWFTRDDLAVSIILNSEEESNSDQIEQSVEVLSENTTEHKYVFTFDFTYDRFPDDIILFVNGLYEAKKPYVELTWITPDGREIPAGDFEATANYSFRFKQDRLLERRLGISPQIGMFADPASVEAGNPVPLKGTYQLVVSGLTFEPESTITPKLVVHGQIYGMFGTDHRRRDLRIPILWGTPIALSFGLLAAVGTSVLTMIIAAAGVWYGGWLDTLIQRITEVNLILPLLPILIMIGTFYSRSIWLMLGVVILLSIFGTGIKTYRAVFLQVRESPYIEAARAYGASNTRIIFRYLIPRIIPLLVPQLVTLVPSFVFLEASLAVLGLGDPVLPTWGKVIDDARANGALFNGYYYWMLEPAILLMLVGLGFSMLGFALDRVFNPRLRGM